MNKLLAELPKHEVRQALGFYFEQDRLIYVAAHVMLRRVLREYLDGAEPAIIRNPLGRPELATGPGGGPALSFSLTHTRGFAACAISNEACIGIDAEDIRRPIAIGEMARRWYAPKEVVLLERIPKERRAEMFFRIWTLKEAILKATGHGLRIEPPLFSVDPERAQVIVPAGLGIPTCWRLAEMTPSAYIRLALAVPGNGPLAPALARVDLA
jgi:4'-phosphopantetheinyl transferase